MVPTWDGGVRRGGFLADAGGDLALVVVALVPTSGVLAGDLLAAVHGIELDNTEGLDLRGAVGNGDSIEAVGAVVTPGGGEADGAAGLEGERLDGIGVVVKCPLSASRITCRFKGLFNLSGILNWAGILNC